jgi:predicted MFS family arabinose efflux permease
MLTNRLRQDTGLSCNGEHIFSWQQVRSVFVDWKVYLYMFIYVGNAMTVHCQFIYLPTLISKSMKFTNANAQLMSAPPHVISCLTTLIVSFSAGHFNERGYHLSVTLLISVVGYILLITLTKYSSTVLYIATCITCVGTCSAIPLIVSWLTNNIGGHTKRAVTTGFVLGFGNISGIVASHVSFNMIFNSNFSLFDYKTR